MTRIRDTLLTTFAPHRRAEELVDARIDARRDGPPLDPEALAWLEAHLEACPPCAEMAEARRAAVEAMRASPRLVAPEGFAARVLAAAREEGRAAAEPVRLEPARRGVPQWALGVAAVAATVAFVVLLEPRDVAPEGTVEVSGAAAAAAIAADFEVRAPSLGAAELRAVVSRIAQAHAGQVSGSGDTITVRIPRGELVGVLQDLAQATEVSVTPQGQLAPERETVVLRVNLD